MALFTLYFLYGMVKIPLLEYISCLTIGAIIYGITHSIEFGVLALLIANLILPMFRSSKEGFSDATATASATPAPSKPVANAKASNPTNATPEVTGAVESSVQDAGTVGSATPTSTFAGSSTPASAVASAKVKKISEKDVPPANQPADLIKDGFEDKSGLFKLGEIPTDEKGGFHIDAGSSVLNALKSLKPDQISAMTQDTKQLIETQKTLMNMLQSFKPMLSEGKDMMDTFQQMFSPSGGSAMGALQAAQDTLKSQ